MKCVSVIFISGSGSFPSNLNNWIWDAAVEDLHRIVLLIRFLKYTSSFSFSDLSRCLKPINCEENVLFESCEQLDNAKFQNHGCKFIDVYSSDVLYCTNRVDISQDLFENPPLPKKVYYSKGILFNSVLSFDENHIYCGEYNFTYEDLNEIREMHGQDDCTLLDGSTLAIWELWEQLLIDFSFKGTEKIGVLL